METLNWRLSMISVIIPVYNVEAYLEECLDSVKNQTYTDIEVILVNEALLIIHKQFVNYIANKTVVFT